MLSLKNPKMKKVELFSSEEETERAFASLEEKVKDAFVAFTNAKRRSFFQSRNIFLD